MSPHNEAVRLRPDGDIAWIEFDLPGEKVNKLTSKVLVRLLNIIEELSQSKYKAVVLISKKNNNFFAGADIEEIKDLKVQQDARDAAAFGQSIFTLLEALPMPTIAAINGACVGGGCELVLACDYRIATDDASTKIGLPEVLLGIIPGFGGTQRLPRLIGLQASLDIILAGKTVLGTKAYKAGLVDLCVPKELLLSEVKKFVNEVIKKGKRRKFFSARGLANTLLEGPLKFLIFKGARDLVLKNTKGHYPAPLAALDVVRKTYGKNLFKGFNLEADVFGKMAVTEVSKNLISLFYMTESVKKQTGLSGNLSVDLSEVKNVGVLGAGTMGGGIAQLAADKGMSVRVKDVSLDAITKGLKTANDLFSKDLKRKKITKYDLSRKMSLISGGVDYAGFKELDVIIEAIVEDMNIKKKVLSEMASFCKADAIVASNTSSLSITEMSTAWPNRENFVGMHFFNPVNKMPLIEVIRGTHTSDKACATIFALSKKMGKTPIVVKDGPGFLVNRLLLPYLNEACYVFAEGLSVEYIDKTLLKFGMPMGPLHLIDEVGIDVAAKVAKILYSAFGVRAEPASVMSKIVEAKKLGKKNNSGFYIYDSAGKKLNVDGNIHNICGVQKTLDNKYKPEELVHRVLFPMVNEAALCLEEKIVETAQDVDLGMIMGTGFPPFRGGLLKWADSLGVSKIVDDLEEMAVKFGPRFKPSGAIFNMARSGKKFYQ
ncbi:MAG: enoyl-CoA hydratase/isomerase family protein [Oligoflexia bacterium]|nr:enoyl-CoA hydratase/isomerase family protein [Oligoflexia bacterium]